MTDAARDRAPIANPDGRDPNVWSEYEIETQTSLVDRALRTLKHGDAFAVLDSSGDIGTIADTAEGLFYRDTRYLSHYELRIEGKRPLLLSSSMHEDKSALSVALANPDIDLGEHGRVPRDTIFLERTKFVWNAVCYERVSIKNYDRTRRRLRLDVLFDADFHDLFEVRGTKRRQHGRHMAHPHRPDRAEFRYEGLDGIERRTVLSFTPAPKRLDSKRATFEVELGPDEATSLIVTVACEEGEATGAGDFFRAYRDTRRARRTATAEIATVATSSELFDEVACRATSDVYTLITRTDHTQPDWL